MTLPAQDIVERLRDADANSQQRVFGSRIFGEAAATISRLTAARFKFVVAHRTPRREEL